MKRLKIISLKDLQIGVNELDYLQDAIRDNLVAIITGNLMRPGLLTRKFADGDMDDSWKMVDGGGDGKVTVKVGTDGVALAVTKSGKLICLSGEFSTGVNFIPNGFTRNVLLKHTTTNFEPGTINVIGGGSKIIFGVGTFFTALKSKTGTGTRGDKIRIIGSAQGNDGTYEINQITSDIALTVVIAPPGNAEDSLQYSIAGHFFNQNDPVDPDIHEIDAYELTAEVSPTDFDTEEEFILGQITRNGNALTITDLRGKSTLIHRGSVEGAVFPFSNFADDDQLSVLSDDLTASRPAVIEGEKEHILVMHQSSVGSVHLRGKFSLNRGRTWIFSTPNVAEGDDPEHPSLAILSNNDIMMAYRRTRAPQGIYVTTSSNLGANWTSPVLVRSQDVLTTENHPQLLMLPNGKVLLFYTKVPTLGGGSYGVEESEDNGLSWGGLSTIALGATINDRGSAVLLNDKKTILFVSTFKTGNTAEFQAMRSTNNGVSWSSSILVYDKFISPVPDEGPYLSLLHIPSTDEVLVFYALNKSFGAGPVDTIFCGKIEQPYANLLVIAAQETSVIRDTGTILYTGLEGIGTTQLSSKEIVVVTKLEQAIGPYIVLKKIFPMIFAG